MSYLVLARKWRPRNFSETVGQEHVLKALANALDSGRLHHAYLFAGTRGVGKTTIARILAKALNCERGVSSMPCGECGACNEIDEGRFVDLIEVDAASKTKVDDTRDLLDNVQYAPAKGRYKVYLIDEVHMLSKHSFNALLKTLEEPPPHVKFLLATTDPQKLPVTVLSRCLQFNLKRLTPQLIRERLQEICEREDIGADNTALALIARAADGSLRDALSLLDQAIAYCGGKLDGDAVASMLGTIDRQHVSRMLRLLSAGDARGLMAAIAEIDEQFPDYATLLDDLARTLQKIAIYQVVGEAAADDEIDEAELTELASSLAPEDVQLFYQTALLGRRDLDLAPDPRSGAEMTLLRMLAFRPAEASGVAAVATTKPAAPGVASDPAGPAGKKAAAAASQSHTVAWKEPNWSRLITRLNLTGANKELARNCAYVRRDGNVVHLELDKRSESYLTEQRRKALSAALSQHFGETLQARISVTETSKDTPMQEEARRNSEEIEAAKASLEADPNVKALQDMFNAELIPDSITVVDKESPANRE